MNEPYEMHGTYIPDQPEEKKLTWNTLLVRTYIIYRQRFWTFFCIGLPAGLVAYLTSQFQHALIGQMSLAGWLPAFRSSSFWGVALLIMFVKNGVFWLISMFFFAAIASNVITNQYHDACSLSDLYSAARARLGAVLAVGVITWVLMFLGRLLLRTSLIPFLQHFWHYPNNLTLTLMFVVPFLIPFGLLSRFGLAIPELMADSSRSAGQALRSSLKKTENWEPFFMMFLAKSAIIGYVIYWLAQLGFNELWQRTNISGTAFDWITWAFYICLAAMLESPLFIAFSILYCETASKPEESQAAIAG